MLGASISLPVRRDPPKAPRALRSGLAVPAAPARERARRRVVALVMTVYLLAVVEGALRKWVAPQWSQVLFFLRDPFLLAAYAVATVHGLWPRRDAFFRAGLAFAALGVLLPALQAVVGGVSEMRALLAAYGWRSYFLYLPLAFLVASTFGREDLRRMVRWTLWLAVPIGALVVLQFGSPPGAPINVGIAADEAYQFKSVGLNAERVRPQGPFASGAGQQVFVASAFALLVAGLLAGRRQQHRLAGVTTLLLGGAGILACVALSGSRGTVLQCGLSVAAALVLAMIGRGMALKARALVWPALVAVAAMVLYPIVFPEGFATFVARWTAADASESRSFSAGVFGRALYGFVDFIRLIDTVPALGYGLGYGGNASITLRATVDGVMPGLLAETDFARHMVDLGPAFGLLFIVYRLAFTVWMTTRALRASRLAADPLPLLLLSFAGYLMALGQITGQGTITFYGWFFAGLLLAACRHGSNPSSRRSPT